MRVSRGAGAPAEMGGARPLVLALGSNLGRRRANLRMGLDHLSERLRIDALSRLVESEPWGPVSQGRFLNVVARGRTALDPAEVLDVALAAERAAGRVRGVRYGPRTLDVDLILLGDLIVREPSLSLPHPRWRERPFVAALVAEVAGELIDPVSGRRVSELVPGEALPEGLREVPPLAWTAPDRRSGGGAAADRTPRGLRRTS